MHYIIFDTEWNASKTDAEFDTEMIEIGAVKVSDELEVIDIFSSFIRPANPLTDFTKEFTGITENDILEANPFPDVFDAFQTFIDSDATLVAWGKEDFRLMEIECERYDLNPIVCPTIDLLSVVTNGMRDFGFHQLPSLTTVMEKYELPIIGESHHALVDAKNTFTLFQFLYNKLDVHKKHVYVKTASEKFVYDGSLNTKGKKLLKNNLLIYMVDKKNAWVPFKEFFLSDLWKSVVIENEIDNETLLYFQEAFLSARKSAKVIYKKYHKSKK